jgi:threonine synthase
MSAVLQVAPASGVLRTALSCLRCDALYPLATQHLSCPACLAQSWHVSLRASYSQPPSQRVLQPYDAPFTLGEGCTPCLPSSDLAQKAGVAQLWIKDESRNPTGSHKDRMSAIGITQALQMGAHTVVLASSGNAAISAARYTQAAGLRCEVAAYDGLPKPYADLLDKYGVTRHAFPDNAQRWAFVRERAQLPGYLALTNYSMPALGSAPLAIEGYKLIAQECVDDGIFPSDVVVPTARGDLAWGIFAGFTELIQAGRISELPRIWIVEPFARLARVFEGGDLHADYPNHTAQFSTAGATVTYLQYQAATQSKGGAVVVSDEAAHKSRQALMASGISAELCAAGAFAAITQLRAEQLLPHSSRVLWLLTANASLDPSYRPTPQ